MRPIKRLLDYVFLVCTIRFKRFRALKTIVCGKDLILLFIFGKVVKKFLNQNKIVEALIDRFSLKGMRYPICESYIYTYLSTWLDHIYLMG